VLCAIRIVKVATRILSYDTVVIVLRVIHITTDCVDLTIHAVDERASTNPLSFWFRQGKHIRNHRDRQDQD
jgi:hypothetical protein